MWRVISYQTTQYESNLCFSIYLSLIWNKMSTLGEVLTEPHSSLKQRTWKRATLWGTVQFLLITLRQQIHCWRKYILNEHLFLTWCQVLYKSLWKKQVRSPAYEAHRLVKKQKNNYNAAWWTLQRNHTHFATEMQKGKHWFCLKCYDVLFRGQSSQENIQVSVRGLYSTLSWPPHVLKCCYHRIFQCTLAIQQPHVHYENEDS